MALRRLTIEYKEYLQELSQFYILTPNENNFMIWDVILFGNFGTIFEGHIFKCQLMFNDEYPNKAPSFKFISEIFHPNVYSDGKVCISILHDGVDEYEYENINERWSPTQSVHSVLLSILSLLAEPNFNSPANVDASKLWKNNFEQYKYIIYKQIANS